MGAVTSARASTRRVRGKICLGSDYPFPLGEQVPGQLIHEMKLSETVQQQLLYKNAVEWLGLEVDKFI